MSKKRGLLAVVMALAMVFAATIILVDEADAVNTTYISGQITAHQYYGEGTIVVLDGDLKINEDVELTFYKGSQFIVSEGTTLTIEKGADLIVYNGALVQVDGKIDVKTGGTIQNSAAYDGKTKVNGTYAGFYVAGSIDVAKGGALLQTEVKDSSELPTLGVNKIANERYTGIADMADWSTGVENRYTDHGVEGTISGGVITLTEGDGVNYHMNQAGDWGYWIGVKVSGFTSGAEATIDIDGRVLKQPIFAEESFYVVAGKASVVTVTQGQGTSEFIVDARAVGIDGPAGQMIVTGSLNFNSSGTTYSEIGGQRISMSEGATVDIKADVDSDVIVETWSDSKYAIHSSISITGVAEDNTTATQIAGVVDLEFEVSTEKAGKICISGKDDVTTKYTINNLDVSGSVGNGATLAVNESKTKFSTYSDVSGKGAPVYGGVTVTGALDIGEGAALVTETFSVIDVSGSVTVDGKKDGADATLTLGGIAYVSGTVDIGSTYADDNTVMMTLTGSYIVVEKTGTVKIKDYAGQSGPAGLLGAFYVDDDDVFNIVDLQRAVEAVTALGDDEITVMSIAKVPGTIAKMNYKVSGDYTVPADINIVLIGTLEVSKGAILTLDEDAGIEYYGNTVGLVEVKGTFIDYTLEQRSYPDKVENASGPELYIKAEVKATDADETYFKYTTLQVALEGSQSGDEIELFGDVSVSDALAIPEGVTIDASGKALTVAYDAELIVNGTLDLTDDESKVYLAVNGNDAKEIGKVTINNMVMITEDANIEKGKKGEASSIYVSGIYATGEIGDLEAEYFILAPAVAAANSATMETLEVKAKTTYNGELVFTAGEDLEPVITIAAETVFGDVTIDGYTVQIDTDNSDRVVGIFTGSIGADVTAGASSISFDRVSAPISVAITEDDSGDETVTALAIITDADGEVLKGGMTVSEGQVTLAGTLTVGNYTKATPASGGNAAVLEDKAILTIAEGAKLVVPENYSLGVTNLLKTNIDAMKVYSGLVVDGTLDIVEGGLTITAGNEYNYDGAATINSTLYVAGTDLNLAGVLNVYGVLDIETETDDKAKVTVAKLNLGQAPESLGSGAVIAGAINIANSGYMMAYPGTDVSAALINVDASTGESLAVSTEFFINGTSYVTIYAVGDVNAIGGNKENRTSLLDNVMIVGYNTDDICLGKKWFTDASMETAYDSDSFKVGALPALYFKAAPLYVNVTYSVGEGMSMYVDGVKVASGNTVQLAIGTHDVVVSVNPGFTGTTSVTFDGKAVTGGEFTITADMYKVAPGDEESKASIVLSATGDIATVPDTVIDNTDDEKDDGLGLTDILLIVLVVLIVIMAVIVALRMMRS